MISPSCRRRAHRHRHHHHHPFHQSLRVSHRQTRILMMSNSTKLGSRLRRPPTRPADRVVARPRQCHRLPVRCRIRPYHCTGSPSIMCCCLGMWHKRRTRRPPGLAVCRNRSHSARSVRNAARHEASTVSLDSDIDASTKTVAVAARVSRPTLRLVSRWGFFAPSRLKMVQRQEQLKHTTEKSMIWQHGLSCSRKSNANGTRKWRPSDEDAHPQEFRWPCLCVDEAAALLSVFDRITIELSSNLILFPFFQDCDGLTICFRVGYGLSSRRGRYIYFIEGEHRDFLLMILLLWIPDALCCLPLNGHVHRCWLYVSLG